MKTTLLEKQSTNQKTDFDCLKETKKNYEELFSIVEKVNNKKFNYLKYWRFKESKLLLRELKYPRKYFNKYKRGTIIKVDFGVNIGSEFSQIHYAIVLNKDDNRLNNILNVIPLTSKDKNGNYNIGNILFDNFMENIDLNLKKLKLELKNKENSINELQNEFNKIKKIFDFYSNNPVCSFACYKNITTISKTRIVQPINEYDFINKSICSAETMKKIDEKIIKYYTNSI